ncbi:GlxA family transcriptional regulator [Allorhizocola rhizosphaerae]|uniref:GlxA family transcriptional regulator n=1 Tax=Allorhizocola rhizosphaerae TaxID=1872709 RepID=UPI001FEC8A95|nr:DJ-1/PfpI family protein [Allorhizocola rhizosphaerae]
MRVVIAVYDGVELLDVTGPAEVFSVASRLDSACYEIQLAGPKRGPVTTSSGVRLVADVAFKDVNGAVDTVVIPGALAGQDVLHVPSVVRWIQAENANWRRLASVCAGAHLLAAAGVLDGKRATTHWFSADRLAADFPSVDVDPDPIYVRDGRVWTSAGVTSGMDLALALVADDHGERLARSAARWMVMYLRRPGGQSQFSVPLSTPVPRTARIRTLQHWIVEHPDADLSVPALARRAHMSERHFARVFAQETATTPAAFVEASRTEAARGMLEQTDDPLDVVATRCGFGSVETLYRAFRRRLGTTPSDYRHRFRLR